MHRTASWSRARRSRGRSRQRGGPGAAEADDQAWRSESNKLVITATQMMESMIVNAPVPTRAEVSDVANAVLDGTDAVMLSGETASGKYPVAVVKAMASIVTAADESDVCHLDAEFLNQTFSRVDQSIAYGALFTAYHLRCKAIVALTDSGSTALWMSRHDVDIPIFALTPRMATLRKLSLFRNVRAFEMAETFDRDAALISAVQLLLRRNVVTPGDLIVITIGEPMGGRRRHEHDEDREGRRTAGEVGAGDGCGRRTRGAGALNVTGVIDWRVQPTRCRASSEPVGCARRQSGQTADRAEQPVELPLRRRARIAQFGHHVGPQAGELAAQAGELAAQSGELGA